MKAFCRLIFSLLALGSFFILGFFFGREKEKAKIPKFQDDPLETGEP